MFDAIFCGSNLSKALVKGGTCYSTSFCFSPGGAGNVAVGLSKLGEKVVFVGKAGNDYLGRLYIKDLKRNGVLPYIFIEKTGPTGVALTLSTAKDRSFIVYRGANDSLSFEDLKTIDKLIIRSRRLYFSGYSLVNSPQKDVILETARKAHKSKVTTIFDPGASNLIKSNRLLFNDLLEITDVLSTNLEEAKLLTKANTVDEVIKYLRKTVLIAAVRCGEEGSILISGQRTIKTSSFNVKPVDPTGAGDAFTAALIYGVSHDLPMKITAKLANWFGGQAVTRIGSRNFPSKSQINRYLSILNKGSFDACS